MKDNRFAERLFHDLSAKHVQCSKFPQSVEWSQRLWQQIDTQIGRYDKTLLICSKNSLNSEPVRRELERVFQREDTEKKRVLFAIDIDGYIFKWKHFRAADVRERMIGGFRQWRNLQSYQEAFETLIENLKRSRKTAKRA